MRNTLTAVVCLSALAQLAACSGDHEHGSDSDHSAADHSHGPDTHNHDAPETEAFYGDDSIARDDTDEAAETAQQDKDASEANSGEHTHGNSDEPHTHGH